MQAMIDFCGLFMDVYIDGLGKYVMLEYLFTHTFTIKVWRTLCFHSGKEVSVEFRCVLRIYSYNMMAKKSDNLTTLSLNP